MSDEDRSKWTYGQWWQHVGAWENAQGEIVFGSPMAVRAMMIQYKEALHKQVSAELAAHAIEIAKNGGAE